MLHRCCARNWDDLGHPWLLRDMQNPIQRELSSSTVLLAGHELKFFNELQVVFEDIRLEAWEHSAEVSLGKVVKTLDLAGEHPFANRRVAAS